MQSQISYLTALLSAGLTHKTTPGVDLSKADWDTLIPFIEANHLQSIAAQAFTVHRKLELPLPDAQVVMNIGGASVKMGNKYVKQQLAIKKMARRWHEEGKCPLALGGIALSVFYPSYARRGDDTLVCIPLHQKAVEGDAEMQNACCQTLDEDFVKVVIPDAAVGTFGGRRDNEADAILCSAFYSAPCELHPGFEIAYPAPVFLGLYHLYTAQQLLLNARLPFYMVVDWAALLHAFAKMNEKSFDWASFLDRTDDLGLLTFTQTLTALAVRLTGITLPEAAASLTAADADVDYLLQCILAETQDGDVSDSRFSRFFGVLRNSKKYSRFSDSSPLREAFHYLFK